MAKRARITNAKPTSRTKSRVRKPSIPGRGGAGREVSPRKRAEQVIHARWRILEFAATHGLTESLEKALDEAGKLTGSPVGFYHFVERDEKTLSLQAWSTRTKAEFCKAEGQGLHYSIDQAGVWTDCVRKRRAVIHNDYASLPHRKGLPEGHAPLVRELVVPVFREDRIVAILGVGNKAQDYTRQDVELATFVADLAWEIAERKRTEQELQTTRAALEDVGIGVLRAGPDAQILGVNAALCRSLGYTEAELRRLTIFDIDPTFTPERWRVHRQTIAAERTRTFESVHRRKDESTFPVEVTVSYQLIHGRVHSLSFVRDITERKRAEAALRESEERYALAQRAANMGSWDWNIQTGEIRWSEQIAGLFGLPPGTVALSYEVFLQSVHAEDREAVAQAVKAALEADAEYHIEHRIVWPDGTVRWVSEKGEVLRDAGGKPVRMLGVVWDITELQEARQNAAQSEVRFRTIVQQSSDLITLLDPQGKITYISPQGERVLGYRPEDLVGHDPMAYVHADDVPHLRAALDQVVHRTNPGIPTEFRFRHAQGHWIELEALGTNLLDHPGIRGLLVTCRDVTERNRAQEALRAKTEELNQFFTVALDLLCIADTGGHFRRLNPQWEKVLGYSLAELEGQSFLDLVHPEDRSATLAAVGRLAEQKAVMNFVNRYRCKDGSYRWIEWRSYPSGNLIYSAARDITERRQTEAALERERSFANAVLDSVPGLLYLYDDQGRLIRWNKQHETLTGYSAGELAQMTLLDWYRGEPEEAARIAAAVQRIPREGHAHEEAKLVTKSGERIPFFFNAVNLRIEERDYFVGIGIDLRERQQAEKALRESEQRLRLALAGTNQGLYDLNLQTGKSIVSPEYLSMLGYGADEVEASADWWREQVHPDDLAMATRTLLECKQGQRSEYRMEYRLKSKSGDWKWVLSLGHVVECDSAGHPTRMLGTHTDITERKRAERALQESEAKLSSILRAAPTGIGVVSNRVFKAVNDHLCAMTGYSREELLEQNSRMLYPSDEDYEFVGREKYRQIKESGTGTVETRWQRKDGSLIDVLMSSTPIDEADWSVGVTFTAVDITERKRAAEELAASRQMLRAVLDTIPTRVFWKDRNSVYLGCNQAFARDHGVDGPEALIGKSDHDTMTAELAEAYRADDQQVMTTGHSKLGYEEPQIRLDGSRGWLLTNKVPLRDAHGQVVGVLGTYEDITERKRIEAALRESEERFRQMFENSRAMMLLIEPDSGAITEANPAAAEFYGYPREVLCQMVIEDINVLPPDQVRSLRQAASARSREAFVFPHRLANGEMRTVEVRSSPVQVGDRRLLFSIIQDVTERTRAEEALAHERELLSTVINLLPDGIYVKDRDSRFLLANQALAERFGKSRPAELLGLSDRDFFPPAVAAAFRADEERVLAGEAVQEKEEQVAFPNGMERALLTTKVPLRNRRGDIVGLVGTGRDITERKRAEAALRESMTRLQTVVTGAPIVLYSFDRHGVFTLSEGKGLAGLGLKPGEIVGKTIFEVYGNHPEALAALRRALAGETFSVQMSFPAGGTFEVSHVALRDEGGGYAGTIGVLVDITERERAEAAVRASEEKFRALVETTSDFIWEVDAAGRYTYVSPQVTKLLGYTPDEVLGKTPFDLMPPVEAERMRIAFQSFTAARQPLNSVMNLNWHKNGKIVFLETSATPILNAAGDFCGCRGIDRDVTDRKQAEQERERLIRELEAKNAELERFTYTVSHDLKSPLITIKGFAGALLQDVANGRQDRVADDLKRIASATDQMTALLNDLLELSRIGRIMNPPSDVDLTELTREVLELLAGPLSQRQVEVVVQPGLPVVRGDRRRLAEVFQNLIENAVRFMGSQPRPRLEIGMRDDGAKRVFFVRDNGVGIEPRYQETVFGLFNKLDARTPGTGIGLALVRRIIETHGGKVWVESEGLGRGATFCFSLPPHPPTTKEKHP